MSETARTARRSGEVERGEIPEVAALGNALTSLFDTLEISQSAYAVRVCMDKSIVSRYLRGRRVPPQDFIDRLIREAEARRGATVQPEVRHRVSQLRLDALRVCDPAAHQLETLRAEMEQSQRRIQVLTRHQEALHDLLDKKESEVRAVKGELEQVRRDWTEDLLRAGRAEIELREHRERDSTERARLVEEISRLRMELSDVAAQKAEAERRCEDLETRVREMEEELAAGAGSGTGPRLPLDASKGLLAAHVEAGEQREASQELMEAAWGRPVGELVDLTVWLWDRGDFSRRDRLAAEVIHARPVGDVAEFGHAFLPRDGGVRRPAEKERANAPLAALIVKEACAVRSAQDIVTLCTSWSAYWRTEEPGSSIHNPFVALLRSGRHPGDVAAVIALTDPADDLSERLLRVAFARPRRGSDPWPLIPRLVEIGREELAATLCRHVAPTDSPAQLSFPLLTWLDDIDEEHWKLLTSVLVRNVPTQSVALFLGRICYRFRHDLAGGFPDSSPLRPIFEQLAAEGRLAEVVSFAAAADRDPEGSGLQRRAAALNECLTAWRASQA